MKIKESFERRRKNYGYRRVLKYLEAQNESVGKHRVARLMKENNLKSKTRKWFKITTDSKHNKPVKENLVIDALRMALFRRKIPSNRLLHSDRGSQYASENYQQLLHQHQIECSMSCKENCWDNAVAESFFHTLKTQCTYHERFKIREEARRIVFDYIEVFYNHHRRHSYLGYLSPSPA